MPATPRSLAILLVAALGCGDSGEASADKPKAGDAGKGEGDGGDSGDGKDPDSEPASGKRSSLAAAVRDATEKARNQGTAAKRVCDKLRELAASEGSMRATEEDMAECIRELEAKGRADADRLRQLASCMDHADDMGRAMTCMMDDARLDDDGPYGKEHRKEDAKYDPWDAKLDEKVADKKAEYTDGGW